LRRLSDRAPKVVRSTEFSPTTLCAAEFDGPQSQLFCGPSADPPGPIAPDTNWKPSTAVTGFTKCRSGK